MAKEAYKTNAMRILEQQHIPYTPHEYPHHGNECVDGEHIVALLGLSPQKVCKTLVTQGTSRAYYVFVLPVETELDLKKAAAAVGEKAVAMIPVAEINKVTGYIRGGCSPVGMKKRLVTTLSHRMAEQDTVLVSAGKIGYQMELRPTDLQKAAAATFADITA